MKITNIEAYALSCPIDPVQKRQFHSGTRRLIKRDVVLVIVDTADGRRGVATAGASSSEMSEYFGDDSHRTFADVITGPVADVLENERINTFTDAHDRIEGAALSAEDLDEAVSAVDIALYDIRGKELGAPVYELLAEKYDSTPTTELDLYASAGMYMQPEGYARQAAVIEELGFFGYKYRPGIGIEQDKQTIEILSNTLDSCEFMLDCHTWWKGDGPYDYQSVNSLVEYAGKNDAYWVEEPVEPEDYRRYTDLAKTGVPLAGGESESSPDGLIRLGQTGAVKFLQGDVRHHRGYTGCHKVVTFCADSPGVQFIPHNFGTWVGLAANAHLVAAGPGADLVEYPVFTNDPVLETDADPGMYPFDLAFDIVTDQPMVNNGALSVPDDPGLGIEVNLDVIEKYPYTEGPWTEFDFD